LKYAGTASRFEGKTVVPSGEAGIGLQVIAVDPAGNTGVHTRDLSISP
jgi:hypothetical protein